MITFFRDVLEKKKMQESIKADQELNLESLNLPIYEMETMEGLHLLPGYKGFAGSAGFLEELIAYRFDKFIVCGGAGPSIVGVVMAFLTYDKEQRHDYWRRCFSLKRIGLLWWFVIF